MAGTTSEPSDPGINKPGPTGQNEKYLVLSEEERAKGFIRPVRRSYIHQKCGVETRMGLGIAESFARDPKFYGATYCVGCRTHFPVGEFRWSKDDEVVGS